MDGRVLAVDVGARRVGLAISDVSCTLARPLETIAVASEADAVDRVARRILELGDEDGGLAAIVSSGRASVPDTSLIARPTRRAPTSTARTRPSIRKCYNFALPNIL